MHIALSEIYSKNMRVRVCAYDLVPFTLNYCKLWSR